MPPQLDDLGTKQVISGTPASDDLLPFYDISEFGNDKLKKTTVAALLGGASGSTDTIATSDGTAAAAAGDLGEYVQATAPGTSLTNAAIAAIASVVLTPGDWDVQGVVTFVGLSATISDRQAGIDVTNSALSDDAFNGRDTSPTTTSNSYSTITLTRKRVLTSTTTTRYLVVSADFSAGDVTAYGAITARRVR